MGAGAGLLDRPLLRVAPLRHIDRACGMSHRDPAVVLHVDADTGCNDIHARVRRRLVRLTARHAYQAQQHDPIHLHISQCGRSSIFRNYRTKSHIRPSRRRKSTVFRFPARGIFQQARTSSCCNRHIHSRRSYPSIIKAPDSLSPSVPSRSFWAPQRPDDGVPYMFNDSCYNSSTASPCNYPSTSLSRG